MGWKAYADAQGGQVGEDLGDLHVVLVVYLSGGLEVGQVELRTFEGWTFFVGDRGSKFVDC